jgi:leucyl/phenylalanyl-tRNA--protein transferase
MSGLSPDLLLDAYCSGLFPMADAAGRIGWYRADPRGILPLERFHISHTLGQLVRQNHFEIRINHDFARIMRACATGRPDGTWINEEMIQAYVRLHEMGFAHSVEAWLEGQLAGGLYGVSIGGAFFGESMFHLRANASKVALVHLVDRLRQRGYELLDAQAVTPHLQRFGAVTITASRYIQLLRRALDKDCTFV